MARIAATAPESAREAAGAAGARIPPVTAADKAAAAVALASTSVSRTVSNELEATSDGAANSVDAFDAPSSISANTSFAT